MLYTVKEVSSLSRVTIKTLHHYHKIGLLLPRETSEAGYRLYGEAELERLQHILFYRELDLPLEQIKQLLDGRSDRLSILTGQEQQLMARQRRLETILRTLNVSIISLEGGKFMKPEEMFVGFSKEAEWKDALQEQREHVQEAYGYDMLEENRIDVAALNEQATEAAAFMTAMSESLRSGVKHSDDSVRGEIRTHLAFMNDHGHSFTPEDFAAQARFFVQDDFHRHMLEGQQTGLAYYLAAAAEAFASVGEAGE